jgi:hypothetical protein
MKSLVKKIFFVFILFFLLYSVIWYYFATSLERSLNESKEHFSGQKYQIGFKKVSKTGFPFKIAFKCEGLSETHAEDIFLESGSFSY